MADTSTVIAWIGVFGLIYIIFLKPNTKGEAHYNLGGMALILNSLAGFVLASEYAAFVALLLSSIYTFTNWRN